MADKDINIIDETEETVLTPEEIEELERIEREERIKKASRKKSASNSKFSLCFKIIMGVGLLGMVISMLLESGYLMTVSLITVAVSGIISYFFFTGK